MGPATTRGHPQGWEYPLTLSHQILVNTQEGHMAGALFIYFTGRMLTISVDWNARIGPQGKKMLQDPGLERYKSKAAWYTSTDPTGPPDTQHTADDKLPLGIFPSKHGLSS